METLCDICEEGTEFLNIIYNNFRPQIVINQAKKFIPLDGCSKFLLNIGTSLQAHMAPERRRS
jgi:hypothetical protein